MAEKMTVGYLPGSDPAAMQANLDYQAALARMEEALNARKNRLFDPTMLAIAEGLLGPGAGPTFGGAIGNVASKLRESQIAQEKEEREIAQAQLGLAGRGLELERLRQRDREFGKLMGDDQDMPVVTPSGELPTGALPSARPTGGALPGPKGFEGVQGIPVAPPNPGFMTSRQYLSMARMDPSISPVTAMKDAQKMEQDRFQVKESGVQDLATGMFFPFPKGEQVTRQLFGYSGEYKVDARTAALLDMYAANGDPKYYEVAQRVVEGPKAPARPGEAPKAEAAKEGQPSVAPDSKSTPTSGAPSSLPQGSTRLMSQQDVDAMSARAKEEAQLEAKRTIAEKTEYIDAGRSVTPRMATINMLYPIASGKNAAQLFGVFERPDVASAVKTLIEGGIGSKNLQLTLPAFRKALTNAGLPQELINQAQMAYSLMAQVQLETSRLGQGQGAVSNFERELFAQASIAASDNPAVILAKLDMLKARANLDKARAEMVRSHKGNLDDLVTSEKWANLTNNYLDNISQIFGSRLAGAPVSKNTQPNYAAVPGRDNAGAAGRLPEGLR